MEILLITILTIHGFVQPYKNSYHNKVDLFAFGMLAVINGITAYNYELVTNPDLQRDSIETIITVQVVLSYIPFLLLMAYAVRRSKILTKVVQFIKKKKVKERTAAFSLSIVDQAVPNTDYRRFS